jgi:hypothetical protein
MVRFKASDFHTFALTVVICGGSDDTDNGITHQELRDIIREVGNKVYTHDGAPCPKSLDFIPPMAILCENQQHEASQHSIEEPTQHTDRTGRTYKRSTSSSTICKTLIH